MHKLGYLWVSYRILERNVYEKCSLEQWCGAIQWAVQEAFEPAMDFKESWKVCIWLLCRQSQAVEFTQAFLAGYTSLHERYDIDIYTQRTTKLFTPIIKSFVALKVLIQNERTRWFTVRTLSSVFLQGIVRIGYSPSLLLLWTLDTTHIINNHYI